MKLKLKETLTKILTWIPSAKPIITTKDYTIQPSPTGSYSAHTVNVAYAGYTPISVGFGANQAICNIYEVTLNPSDNTVVVGRALGSGGDTLAYNVVELKVVYIKKSFL